jgi:ComF family protein
MPRNAFDGALSSFFSLLAPERCAACATRCRARSCFCSACGAPEPCAEAELDGIPVYAAGRYAPPLSDAIRRLKFENHPELAARLATLVLPHFAKLALTARDTLVPVPLHPARLVERGYNQSALLANALARGTSARVAPRALVRGKRTQQQARLGRDTRRENVGNAFSVEVPIPDGRVVLVDDVITTGETVRACLAPLLHTRCEVVAIVALARAGQRSDTLSLDSSGRNWA